MTETTAENAEPRARFVSGIFPKFEESNLDFENDEVLVAAMMADMPKAWVAFRARFDRLVLRSITKVTHRFPHLVSQDDVGDIYATFYMSLLVNEKYKLRAFDPSRGAKFSSWIAMLAANRAYDYLRAIRREPETEDLSSADETVCERPDPFETTAEGERASITQDALESMSEKDRAFAALYFGEGLEPPEVAKKLQISVKTVYSKRHKIQTRLESLLGRTAA
jgi:RNA polymerase sigma-70 factor (ECF subfamily)